DSSRDRAHDRDRLGRGLGVPCNSRLDLLSVARAERLLKPLAAARQPRHDCADGNVGDRGYLGIRKALEFTEHDGLAQSDREPLEGILQSLGGGVSQQVRFWASAAAFAVVRLLVEADPELVWASFTKRGVASVAHDSEQPTP